MPLPEQFLQTKNKAFSCAHSKLLKYLIPFQISVVGFFSERKLLVQLNPVL